MSHHIAVIAYQSNHSLRYWNIFMHNLRNKTNKFAQIFFISMFNNKFKRIFVTISQTTQETFHTEYNNNKILFLYDNIGFLGLRIAIVYDSMAGSIHVTTLL